MRTALLVLLAATRASADLCDGSVSDPTVSAMLGAFSGSGSFITDGSSSDTGMATVGAGSIFYNDRSGVSRAECVLGVNVDFAASTGYLVTGAPGAVGPFTCWNMTTRDSTLRWAQVPIASATTSCAKPSDLVGAVKTGSIMNFANGGSTALVCPLDPVIGAFASVGSGFSIGNSTNSTLLVLPALVAPPVSPGPGVGAVKMQCLSQVKSLSATTAKALLADSRSCAYLKASYAAGVVSVVVLTDNCALTEYPKNNAAELSFAVSFLNPPRPSAGTPAVVVPTAALVTTTVEAVTFDVSFCVRGTAAASTSASLAPA